MNNIYLFWLSNILEPYLNSTCVTRSAPRSVPSGPITMTSHLTMALRYCAVGDPVDIADHHGVHVVEVTYSVWAVIDTIYAASQLNIAFPKTHEEQESVADGFASKSDLDINTCVGAIDGILIWIHKPSKRDVKAIQFGPSKFFCGRKKKFGLNMQAVCDVHKRFLDVEIKFPGSATDFFAFEQSELKGIINKEGFLRPGLALFGDNAYVHPTRQRRFQSASNNPVMSDEARTHAPQKTRVQTAFCLRDACERPGHCPDCLLRSGQTNAETFPCTPFPYQ